MRQTIPIPIITAIASPMMMGSSFPPAMSFALYVLSDFIDRNLNTLTSTGIFLRVFEDLLCLFLNPVGVALAPHVEPSQELRASRTEHAIVILLMSFSSCFVDSHNLVDYPFGEVFVVCMKGPSEVVQRALLERGVGGC